MGKTKIKFGAQETVNPSSVKVQTAFPAPQALKHQAGFVSLIFSSGSGKRRLRAAPRELVTTCMQVTMSSEERILQLSDVGRERIATPAILDEHKIVLSPEVRAMFCKLRVAALTVALSGALGLSACDHTHFFANVNFGPPPPPVFGPVGLAPGAGWVWTDGYYAWGGNAWVWRPGRWARPLIQDMFGESPLTSVTATATVSIKDVGCAADATAVLSTLRFVAPAHINYDFARRARVPLSLVSSLLFGNI